MAKRIMHFGIFGTQRSGTTMLASLCNMPAKGIVCLSEEGVYMPNRKRRHDRTISAARQWGAKEVNPKAIRMLLGQYSVQKIVTPVRDPRHVAMSKYEWIVDRKAQWPLAKQQGQIAACLDYIVDLVSNPPAPLLVVRYEQLAIDPEAVLDELEQFLGFRPQGNPGSANQFSRQRRQHELKRHGGKVTSASQELRMAEARPAYLAYADKIMATPEARRYAEYFGYG